MARVDRFELPVKLVMHGIPESWVSVATMRDLQMMWEIVKRDQNDFAQNAGSYAVNKGIADSFNGGQ